MARPKAFRQRRPGVFAHGALRRIILPKGSFDLATGNILEK